MFEQIEIQHHIQRHIIHILMFQKTGRFSELRPPKVDTNLFTYHLKVLMKTGFVTKSADGYELSHNGLKYVDRVSTEKMFVRTQPKIITMLLVQNDEGDVLLQKRMRQPFIYAWTLPYGKLHIDDSSLRQAAKREAFEKLTIVDPDVTHVGDAYIRVRSDGDLLSTTLAHVFRFNTNIVEPTDKFTWVQPHKLSTYDLAPAVESIVARSFFNDAFFFEEYDEDWI